MPITKLTPTAFEDNVKFRNIIINGDMSIAQRGTSVTSVYTDGYKTTDRWNFNFNGTESSRFTVSQSTTVPSGEGFAKSTKVECTTADTSLGANNFMHFEQRIEGQNLQYLKKGTSNAQKLTLSFWVRSSKTGDYTLELRDIDNARHISKTYNIGTADTWQKVTIEFDADTTGSFDNDNNNSLMVTWWLYTGTDFTSGTQATTWGSFTNGNRADSNQVNLGDSTSNDWYITGVQLEAGEVATPFEFLPHDVNLQRCHRYFYKFPTSGNRGIFAMIDDSGFCEYVGYFPVTMRANPSVPTLSGTIQMRGEFRNGGKSSTSSHSYGYSSNRYLIFGGSGYGGSPNRELGVYNGTVTITADSEL